MLETVRHQWQAKAAAFIFSFFTIWWIMLQLVFSKDHASFQLFGQVYGIMALWGALWGLKVATHWGGVKSLLGKAITMFALGLFAQAFGQVAYSYYVYVLHVEVPYPSLGDLGYFGCIPLYIYGVYLLSKASGVKLGLKSVKSKLQAILIPLLLLILGYWLFLKNYEFNWNQPLTILLDFGYPMGEAIYISLALLTYLLSRNILGGIMKHKILFILFALLVQFLADYTFLYQVKNGTWYVGGINDFMYLLSYFLMAVGLLNFKTVYSKIRG